MRNPHQSLIPAVLVLAFAVGATLLLESSEAGDPQTRRAAAAAGFSGSLGRSVADQGNQALHQIRGES